MQLKDKVAMITGGGRGSDRASAHGFSTEGARVLVSDLDGKSAKTVASELAGEAAATQCNVSDTASGAGLRVFPRAAGYAASKAAVINFTYSLAAEVAKYGITVNAIGPGVSDTPFWRALRSEDDIETAIVQGIVGQPADLVPMVTFLCSNAGAVHTGLMVNRETFMPAVHQ